MEFYFVDPHESGSWNVAGTVFFELDPTIRNLTGILELTVPGILAERMSIQLDHSHTSHAFNISVPVVCRTENISLEDNG